MPTALAGDAEPSIQEVLQVPPVLQAVSVRTATDGAEALVRVHADQPQTHNR